MAELTTDYTPRKFPGPIDDAFKPIGLLIARLVLAWVFIGAGLPKIADPLSFATSIEAFRMIEGSLALWVALLLPWLELVIGFGILTPWLKRASAMIMTALLLLFIGLHASAWIRGLDVNCGCFGLSDDSPAYIWLILRNLGLLTFSLWVVLRKSGGAALKAAS